MYLEHFNLIIPNTQFNGISQDLKARSSYIINTQFILLLSKKVYSIYKDKINFFIDHHLNMWFVKHVAINSLEILILLLPMVLKIGKYGTLILRTL